MEITIKNGGQDVTVEVSIEVYECLDEAKHKSENLSHEQRRHWDGREFDEYIVATEGSLPEQESPEDAICRKETVKEIMSILDSCTEEQRKRFLLYALSGLSYAEIGKQCGCSKVAVFQSIEAVRKKCRKYLKGYLTFG